MKHFIFALALVALTGCGKSDGAFEQLKKDSVAELKLKTQTNSAAGLGKFDSWNLDQDAGQLVFTNTDGTITKVPAQIIGTYNSTDHSWEWAWVNTTIAENLKTDSLKVKNYGERNGFNKLTAPHWNGKPEDAWAMAAVACKVCESRGIFRGDAGDNLSLYISFGQLESSKPK